MMPIDIIKVCFQFWLIQICDEWDREYSYLPEGADIDGQTLKFDPKYFTIASMYGCCGVSTGVFTWEMKLKRTASWESVRFAHIGIIEDKPEVLKSYQNSAHYLDKNGCALHDNGNFLRGSVAIYEGKKYMDGFKNKISNIIMTLDMDNHTLSYNIDGIDYGVATNQLDKDKYRMVVTFFYNKHEIELL